MIRIGLPLLVTCGLTFSVHAQSEYIVNTRLDSTQRDPQIERDASGNYAVVWKSTNQAASDSRGDICLQLFDPTGGRIGGESLVNTVTLGDQDRPALAMNDLGDFVVAWASYTNNDSLYDIKARIYRSGQAVGGEFLVNTTTAFSQTEPDVAIDSDGRFVIVWESWFQDGGDRGVYGQRFDADGTRLGSEFLVNTTTAYSQARPAVKFMHGHGCVVVWESWNQDDASPSGYGMFGRVFDSSGTAVTGEIPLNTYVEDYQWFGDLEILDDDTFVVVWCSWGQDGSEGGIFMQRFSSTGVKIGGEIPVNTTTVNYQWLPKVRSLGAGRVAVVWSSWKQDGSREGVYAQLFDASGRKTSFETQINTTTENYQWEPDFVVTGPDELLVVWSSWGQAGHDYEIVARTVSLLQPQGYLNPSGYSHTQGRSTSSIIVHVVDSLALTGSTYQVSFDSLGNRQADATIRNMTSGSTLIDHFLIDRGEGIVYVTPAFEGLAVEIIPEFDLDLNLSDSYFANHSGANLQLGISLPTAGTKFLAPIDAALVWGTTDTLSDGSYVSPLDTAIGVTGVRNVVVPFLGWNSTDGQRMEMLVVETRLNQRWDPSERILFRTPVPYRAQLNNTHAEIRPVVPAGTLLMPTIGDTNYVLTTRPIGQGEQFTFTADRGAIVDVTVSPEVPSALHLAQNYPNPFNPSTTILYDIPGESRVVLSVYNLLGQRVATLADEVHRPGSYRALFDGGRLASGVYFLRLEWKNRSVVQKMLLMR
jgi:hypothetical protein